MLRARADGGMVARLPTLCHVWQALSGTMLAASAAGKPFSVDVKQGFASRDSTSCCTRTRRQVLEDGMYRDSSRRASCAEGSERLKRLIVGQDMVYIDTEAGKACLSAMSS